MSFSSKGNVTRSTVTGTRGMVASAHPLASLAGLRMLMQGGNAIDAIVATAAALNVVEPYMSGLTGNGYMHIFSAGKQEHQILDYMATTPKAAHLETFDAESHLYGPKTSLTPGACGGWLTALATYGTMEPANVFAPAIEYAEKGVALTVKNAFFYNWDAPNLLKYSRSQRFVQENTPSQAGDIIVQPELARTLRLIARDGADAFYKGEIAERMTSYMVENGGLITKEDLAEFAVEWQEPIHIDYRGYKIYAPEPPCQAVQYFEILNMLEGYDVAEMGHNSAATLHRFLEAAKLATADRIAYTAGDNPPTAGLLSKEYAAERRALIGNRAQPTGGERYSSQKLPNEVEPGNPYHWMQRENTTHFDAIDADGNAVAVTQSLGGLFGSSVVIPGTGLAMNNFMHWLDMEPGSPNVIAPSKKMEMCMSPIQAWKDGKLKFMLGTPGSYGILQTTPQMIMNIIDHGMNIQAAIEAPRAKATSPGLVVDAEQRIAPEVLAELEAMGHEISLIEDFSMMVGGGQGIQVDSESGAFMGGADPRRDGYALGW
ncbi:MAG: gamma-glutamyltransferase [Chloroflexota bacterium]